MAAPLRLGEATLGRLHPAVRVPGYDRRGLTPGLVHIGVGGFHRAHQAVYLDDLAALAGEVPWGCCGVGLLEQDAPMRDALRSQDCLYTVLERGPEGDAARVVGSIVDYVHAIEDRESVLGRLASPGCRIVSLTVTEGGYYRNDATGEFHAAHPDIVHDLAHPQAPRCWAGCLVEALDRRRRAGLGPFTVMSCDNLQHNGTVARHTLLAFAELRDPQLRRWIEEHVAFPNSMVDRIVPATTQEHRDVLARRFGVADAWPVGTEPFRQWVIEDDFPQGRPSWERVGVLMTTDVAPYEKMKMRLLNGSHQALCYIGLLTGYRYVHEAIGDPSIRRLVSRLMDDEVTPLIEAPAGIDLENYKRTLLQRFANPTLRDQLARIAADSSARMPKFVLPSIAEQLRRGGPIEALGFTVAAWFHFLAGHDCEALFALRGLFDETLLQSSRFREQLTGLEASFQSHGARSTLEQFLAGGAAR